MLIQIRRATRAVLTAVVGGVLVVSVAQANQHERKEQVVAKVNGSEIRTSDLRLAADELASQIAAVQADQRMAYLVQYLVERYLIVQAAEKAKITETEEFKRRLRYYAGKALYDAYYRTVIKPKISDATVKAVYEKEIARTKPEDEVRVRQIMVRTEKQMKEITALLAQGLDFVELAKSRSISPAAMRGGDLGYFTKDKVPPDLKDIVFNLKKGEVSKPVKTRFGWQIVRVEDRRVRKLQPLASVSAGIRDLLERGKFREELAELRKQAKIEYLVPDAELPRGGTKTAPATSGGKPKNSQ